MNRGKAENSIEMPNDEAKAIAVIPSITDLVNKRFGVFPIPSSIAPNMANEPTQKSMEAVMKLEDTADGYYFMVPFNRASMIAEILDGGQKNAIYSQER